ncbi:poly-gamma-glutamate biosynthesis protein PgsC [Myxococcota bacterium]|nr:poly-gamma-glutamate biosynthesis protein PgsC [Myxococcota bacterium]
MEHLSIAIGIGLAVSLLFSEVFGLAAGGMVVPGYVALAMAHPIAVVVTIGVGLATFAIVQAAASVIIVYGRRRTVLTMLVGFILGAIVRAIVGAPAAHGPGTEGEVLTVVGHVIPGLIAIWFERQGVVATTATLLTASVVVRLSMVLLAGLELLP